MSQEIYTLSKANCMKRVLILKNWIKLNCLIVIITLITCICPSLLHGQIKLSYSIGGIGNFVNKSSGTNATTYSSPLIITGTKCFTVSNGLIKFMPVSEGQFFTSCEVNLDYIKLNISIYPNPASNHTIIKFLNPLQFEDKFHLQVFSSVGDLVDAMDVSQKQLLAGFKLPLEKFNAGLYYIQISSATVLQTYKIFKI